MHHLPAPGTYVEALIILLALNALEASFGTIIGHAEFAKMTSPPTRVYFIDLKNKTFIFNNKL